MNQLLFGHNPEEGIVAVDHVDDGTVRLWRHTASGTQSRDEQFYPFFFLSDRSHLEGFGRKHWTKELDGNSHFRYVCAFEGWSVLWDAIRHLVERHNRQSLAKIDHYTSLDTLALTPDPVTQYLVQSGRTLFKGMEFADLLRLQLDIETYSSLPGRFGNATRPGDRIILIALSDSTGWNELIDGSHLNETRMLEKLVACIRDRDPDVIEGHNIYDFDLPYILKRCELNNIPFAIGRDGSPLNPPSTSFNSTGRSARYSASDVNGRQVIDTLLLVRSYDRAKHAMENHSLKYAAQFFGIAPPNRTYIQGEKISWHWDNDPEPLKLYAMDDVFETRGISDHLSGAYFYLTQILPMTYSSVIRSGSAVKIDNLMLREYLHQRVSIPKARSGYQTTGGYTDIFIVGILGPILHVDIESLYPSIMISKGIKPRADSLGVFTNLLKELTTLRIDAKHRMLRAEAGKEWSRLDAMQSSLKILINSFYGYLGYNRGLFNDHARADEVTTTGQELLRLMMTTIRQQGGMVIEVDTDGIYFVPPESTTSDAAEQELVSHLSRQMPEGITVTLDGRFKKMVSYKKKNYALLGYDDRITIKGSSLISRSIEPFGRVYIRTCISCLLQEDIAGLHRAYVETREKIAGHGMKIRDFARVEALSETLADYRNAVEAGKRSRSAPYEIALASGRQTRRGERIAYYVTGSDPNPRSFENCRAAAEWDPNFPDENIAYYLRRLNEFSEKFLPFLTPQDHRRIFSPDDLFPFSSEGIALLGPETVSVQDENSGDSKNGDE